MAIKVPLNYFRRKSALVTQTDTPVYTVPLDVAGIIISAYATNLTTIPQTVTVKLSSASTPNSLYTILNNYTVPGNDAVNLAINKIVLAEYDTFIISSTNLQAVNVTLSILESINTL